MMHSQQKIKELQQLWLHIVKFWGKNFAFSDKIHFLLVC